MLIILFKPIAYSCLLSKTIGLANLIIKFSGLFLPLFLTKQHATELAYTSASWLWN